MEGHVEVLLSTRSKARLEEKIRTLVPRKWGGSLKACIQQLNGYLLGWIGYFGCCTAGVETTRKGLDAPMRRRRRAVPLAHWKRKRPIAKKLMHLGIRRQSAWRRVYEGRKSLWAMSHMPTVD
jgi:hypothetical protein